MSEGSKEPTCSAHECEVSRACANCENYNWSQPADLSNLLTCSKCKFISYCTKECQLEHWVKVHKLHCKYLADQKVMPQSRHDPANCATCVQQTKIGLAEISKPENPSLCCPFQLNHVCFGCSEDILVSEVIFSRRKDMERKKVVPFKFQGDATAYFCADPICSGQVLGSTFWQAYNFITHLYMKTSFESRFQRCDYCCLPSKGCIHRCTGCLTKLYCGEQCRDEDWEMVHRKVCKKGEVSKVKGGKQERKQDVSKRFDELVEHVERMDVDDKARRPLDCLLKTLNECK
jgi:hypothetical protein